MFSPQFIVTGIGAVSPVLPNQYFQTRQEEEMWKVSMASTYFGGQTVDFFFPTEAETLNFAKWKTYEPKDILDISGSPTTPFIAVSTEKIKMYGRTNEYTDRADVQESWKTTLINQLDQRLVQWGFPSEAEANEKFNKNEAYSVLDMFGTLHSVPIVVAQSYEFAAEQAAERAREAEAALYAKNLAQEQAALTAYQLATFGTVKAQAKANVEGYQALSASSAYENALRALKEMEKKPYDPKKLAAEKERVEYLRQRAVREESESVAATAAWKEAVNQERQAASNVKRAMLAVKQRTIPGAVQEYTISNGGAAGYYNGVYYASGTFMNSDTPVQWRGIYERK